MKANLATCLDKIGLSEAGYTDHPQDPGGPTNFGITWRTLEAWRKRPVPIEDVKTLTVEEARDILASQYATPIRFDDLPAGLDYCVLDCCVNSGPNRAARLLQQTLGMPEVAVDGIIGAHTLAEISEFPDTVELIESYCAARLDFMRSLATWGTFGNGWAARVKRVQLDAAAMARGRAVSATIPVLPLDADSQAKAGGAVKVTATRSGKAALLNVGTTVVAVVVSAGGAASQAVPVLQPYVDVSLIRHCVLGLTVVSAAGTFVVAWTRAKSGATS